MAEADRIKVYLAVFRHSNLDVDWKAFSAELGISLTGNAQRKFKDCLKKDGYQMANGKIGPFGEVLGDASAASTLKRKSKQTKPTKSPAKKRKIEEAEEDENDTEENVSKQGEGEEV